MNMTVISVIVIRVRVNTINVVFICTFIKVAGMVKSSVTTVVIVIRVIGAVSIVSVVSYIVISMSKI